VRYIRAFKVQAKRSGRLIDIKPTSLFESSFEEQYCRYNKESLYKESLLIYHDTVKKSHLFDSRLKSEREFHIIYGSAYLVYIQAYLQVLELYKSLKEERVDISKSDIIQVNKIYSNENFFAKFFTEKYWTFLFNAVAQWDLDVPLSKKRINIGIIDSRSRSFRIFNRIFRYAISVIPKGFFYRYQLPFKSANKQIRIESTFKHLCHFKFVRGLKASSVHSENLFWNSTLLKSVMLGANRIETYQHGGNIGLYDYNSFKYYQDIVSDVAHYWYDKNSALIFNKTLKLNPGPSELSILFILVSIPKYNYYVHGFPLSNTYKAWLDFAIEASSKILISEKLFRLYTLDYEWDTRDYLVSRDVRISDDNYLNSLSKSSLNIVCYNATVFLQSIELKPTILLLHESVSEIGGEFSSLFKKMIDCGLVVNESNLSALLKFKTSEDISDWWLSEEVSSIKAQFINQYMRNV
jgi:hypothetical protein